MEQQIILAVLEKHPEINTSYVFGSIAKGTATPDSDLDIADQSEKSLTTENMYRLLKTWHWQPAALST